MPADGVDLRRDYYPTCFDPGPGEVEGQRVLLIEDSWVTGATAVSAAGALLGRGAESVVILSLARIVDVTFWAGHDHPYLPRVLATSDTHEPFQIDAWRR